MATHQSALDPVLTAALEQLAAAHGVSLFQLLLAVHVRCLARWSGQREIAVNVARARRDDRLTGLDRLVGPLADTLPCCAGRTRTSRWGPWPSGWRRSGWKASSTRASPAWTWHGCCRRTRPGQVPGR